MAPVSPDIRTHRLPCDSSPKSQRSQRGFIMVETLLAIGITGTAILAVVMAFSTASKNAQFVDDVSTAEWLATSQIELVRAATFVATPGTYTNVAAPTGFGISNATSAVTGGDSNIQIVTVTVTEGGETVFEASTMKVNR